MDLTTMLYLASISEHVFGMAVLFMIFSVAYIAIAIATNYSSRSNGNPMPLWQATITFVISFILVIFTPSTTAAYAIVGAQVLKQTIDNPDLARINQKILTVIESKLDHSINK